MKEIISILIAFLAVSNVSLWINIWNLRQTHSEFALLTFKLLDEIKKSGSSEGNTATREGKKDIEPISNPENNTKEGKKQ